MPTHLLIATRAEYLGNDPSEASGLFGMTLSVGVEAPGDPQLLAAADWACPWHWKLTALEVAVKRPDNSLFRVPPASVKLIGVHEPERPERRSPTPPREHAVFVTELEARHARLRTSQGGALFLWEASPDSVHDSDDTPRAGETPLEAAARQLLVPWPLELYAAGRLGAPHAHWLNLSVFFRIDPMPAVQGLLVAAPVVTLRPRSESSSIVATPAGFRIGSDPRTIASDYTLDGTVADFAGVRGVCGTLQWPAEPIPSWPHKGIAVRSWRGTLFEDAARQAAPTRLLAKAAEALKGGGAADWVALRNLVVDSTFWAFPQYRGPAATEVQGVEDLRRAFARDKDLPDPEAAADGERAAAILESLIRGAPRPELELGPLPLVSATEASVAKARRKALREALAATGSPAAKLAVLDDAWIPSEGAGAEEWTRFLTQLRDLGDALSMDDAVVDLWSHVLASPLAPEAREALKRILDHGRRLASALDQDVVRRAWKALTSPAAPVADARRFGEQVARNLDEISGGRLGRVTGREGLLLAHVAAEAGRQWTLLVPADEGEDYAREGGRESITPHPLVLRTDDLVVDPSEVRAGARGDEEKLDDWDDPVRRYLGLGLLVRSDEDEHWRCPTLGIPAKLRVDGSGFALDRFGTQLTVLPAGQAYRDGLLAGTLTYDGRWLGAVGPEEKANNHGAYSQPGADGTPLAVFAAPLPETPPAQRDPWTQIPLPRFGHRYRLASFRISMAGALPPEIRTADDPGRLRPNASGAAAPAPPSSKPIDYRRAVPVGAPRLCNASGLGAAALRLPDVKDVHLRAVEVPGPADEPRQGPRAGGPGDEAGQSDRTDGVLLLALPATGPGTRPPTVPQTFTIGIRPPAVPGWDTWFRWQFKRHTNLGGEKLAAIRAIWTKRENEIHGAVAGQTTPPHPLTLDDPAVTRLGVVLLKWNGRGWHPVKTPVVVTPRSAAPVAGGEADGVWIAGLPSHAATNAGSIPLQITAEPRGEEEDVRPGAAGGKDSVSVVVVEGGLYQVAVFSLVDGGERAAREWPVAHLEAWQKAAGVPAGVDFGGRRAVSSARLYVEVATRTWRPGTSEELFGTDLYQALTASVDPARTRIRVELRTTLEKDPFIQRLQLQHQRWSWSGRPIDREVLDQVGELQKDGWLPDPATKSPIVSWESAEFGDLSDTGYEQEMETRLARAGTGEWVREWKYDEDLAGEEAASYHRFALVAHHRYARVFTLQPLVALNTPVDWRWHSLLVKARPTRKPAAVVLRRIYPNLLSGEGDSTEAGSAGVTLVAADGAFEHGGLAERWSVEVLRAAGPADGASPTGRYRVEASVDPRAPRSIMREADLEWTDTLDGIHTGPFGHTLEQQIAKTRIGRFTSHSFTIRPTLPREKDDVTWLVRLRYRRKFSDKLVDETVGETDSLGGDWGTTTWIPIYPDRRLIATDANVAELRVRVASNRAAIELLDRQGRSIGMRSSQADRDRGVLEKDNLMMSAFLFVTQRIREIGGQPSEAPVGLFQADGLTWRPMPRCAGAGVPQVAEGGIYARLLYVSHRPGADVPTTEDEVWERILGEEAAACSAGGAKDPITAIRNRLGYEGYSDPISERSTAPDPQP